MKHTSKFRSLAAALFTIGSLAGGANGANIISNGDFETGNFIGWTVGITPDYASGGRPFAIDTTGDGWEVSTTGAITSQSARNGFDGGVVDGSENPLFDADLDFFLRQDFSVTETISLATLAFDFDITGGPNRTRLEAPTEDRVFSVRILDSIGTVVGTLYTYTVAAGTVDSNPLQNILLDVSSSFSTLSNGDYSLEFHENIPQYFTGPGGFVIDNISLDIETIPEPSSALLFGLGALGMFVRRRRQ